MNIENSIKDVISQKLEDGTIEKLVGEQLEKGVTAALDNLFRSYGDVTKIIEEKVKSVMVPYLESYDYSHYLVKLDNVLVEVLKSAALDNKKLLGNFKELMVEEKRKSIKVSELFSIWTKYVEKNVETDGLDITYDDGVSYESVSCIFEFIEDDNKSWSSFEDGKLTFECEHDEKMNFEIKLSRYGKHFDKPWDICYKSNSEIRSLRYLDEFEVLLIKLDQADVKIEMDEQCGNADIYPNEEPEASFE